LALRVADEGYSRNAIFVLAIFSYVIEGQSWSWSYGSWIHNYPCNKCILPLKLCVWTQTGEVYSIQHYMIKFVS